MAKTNSIVLSVVIGFLVGWVARSYTTVQFGSTFDPHKLEMVYRSAKRIQAAVNVGVSYRDLNQSLRQFASEILIAKDGLKDDREK